MSDYEGLNLPDLMDLMHGIVVPEPVSMAPQTSGWWVALAWLAAVIVIVVLRAHARRRANAYRREAVAALKDVAADGPGAAREIASIVRRTALAAYPRAQVASLYGGAWVEFLKASSNQDRQVVAAAEKLAAAPYRGDVDAAELVAPARRWIEVHRA